MKIGIVVYSNPNTNNTFMVANRLFYALRLEGFDVSLERIVNEGDYPTDRFIHLTHIPQISKYDVIIFGSPVEGMQLSKVMQKYLTRLESLKNKTVLAFVTQFFPWPFLGGNNALKMLEKKIILNGGKVSRKAAINWSSRKREKMIDDLVHDFIFYLKELK